MPVQNNQVKNSSLKTLLSWSAPNRLFKRRSREYFTTILAIAFLLGVILFFFKEWFLIMVVVAFVFVTYVMGTIPPENVEHKITNRGIITGEKNYRWNELGRFWLTQKDEQNLLFLETSESFPKRLILLLGEIEPKKVKKLLLEYLPYEEPAKTWMEKAGEWLSAKFPLEK